MKIVKVELENKTLEVKQLPLRKYADLLKAVQNLPKQLGGIENLSNEAIFNQLPLLVANSLPDLIGILTIATDLTQEEIEADDFGLKQATDVVLAIMEVNDYKAVFEQIKKAMARPTNPNPKKQIA